MEKINSLFFLSILLVLAYSQLSDKGTPINLPRKLQEKLNETILLGYENYNITSKDGLWAYFDTIFYLKNWTTDYINIMSNTSDYFIIKSIISNLNESKQIDFTCNNDYQWFYSYNLDNYNDHCKENGYCFAKYACEANITGLGVLKKINLTTNFSEEATPRVLFAMLFIGGGGTALLDKKKVNPTAPSNTTQLGITIPTIPPVDKPLGFFFCSILGSKIVAFFPPSIKSNIKRVFSFSFFFV